MDFPSIHSDTKTQWEERLQDNWYELLAIELPMECRKKLVEIARGIGDQTIDRTLAEILEEKSKQIRGF